MSPSMNVPRSWSFSAAAGQDAPKLYCTDEDRAGDWNGALPDPAVVDEAWRAWRTEIRFADDFISAAADLDVRGLRVNAEGITLRWVLVHMIEEYARHCGHADLQRETIDGRVGQ